MEKLESERVQAKAIALVISDPVTLKKYYLKNIKGGGILIETEDSIPMGSPVLLMLKLPDKEERIPVSGKVVFIIPATGRDGTKAAIGVQITNDRIGVQSRILGIISGIPESKEYPLAF